MTTSKILWNSTISTPDAQYMCADSNNFYLEMPMDRFEYMCMKIELVPQMFIGKYQLQDEIYNGYLYMEIRCGMYRLLQAGMLQ